MKSLISEEISSKDESGDNVPSLPITWSGSLRDTAPRRCCSGNGGLCNEEVTGTKKLEMKDSAVKIFQDSILNSGS